MPATPPRTTASRTFPDALELTDGRLLLRRWQETDAEPLFDAARESVASVARWLPWCHANYQLLEAVAWIAHCRAHWQAADHLALPIFDALTGELLGAVGLNQFITAHHSANLGDWVRQSRQRQGIAAAAVRLVARFGFEQLGLARIEIVALPDNLASRRTAEKLGAQFETIARHRLCVDGQPCDAAVYALIPADLSQAAGAQERARS